MIYKSDILSYLFSNIIKRNSYTLNTLALCKNIRIYHLKMFSSEIFISLHIKINEISRKEVTEILDEMKCLRRIVCLDNLMQGFSL